MKMNKKLIVATAACAALLVGSISTSLAWLVDKTTPVTNTFTDSDISVSLAETTKDFQMVPGHSIPKDPQVTIALDSEPCYVFVKIDKNETYATYLAEYAVNTTIWKKLTDVEGVYYTELSSEQAKAGWSGYVLAGCNDVSCAHLKDGEGVCTCANGYVNVLETVTKQMMNDIKDGTVNEPTLTFTAYAVQSMENTNDKFTPAEAWAKVTP